MAEHPVDPDRLSFDREVRRMAGVLAVADEHPEPGDVTLRVVRGHGDRLRRAARAIAPPDVAVHVLEDDLVAVLPPTQPSIAPSPSQVAAAERGHREDAAPPERSRRRGVGPALRCSYVFCRQGTTMAELGVLAGDRCRRKIRTDGGWLPCPGHYEPDPPPRRRWWGGTR